MAWKRGEKKIRTAFNCRDCLTFCEASEWRKNGGYRCAACRAKYHRHYRLKRPESYGAWFKEYQRQHYLLNKDAKHRQRICTRMKDPLHYMYEACRSRCKKKGIPFSITLDDLRPLPPVCPVLGMPMRHNTGLAGPDSYSIDRVVPSRGYVPGNVRIISMRANTIKTNATPDELRRVAIDSWTLAGPHNIPVSSSSGEGVASFSFVCEPSPRDEAEITA